MKLPIKAIRLDFRYPEYLFGEKVWGIAQAMPGGEAFPPIVVRFDGEHYWFRMAFTGSLLRGP
jgi:hypothetical protein